VNPSIVKMFGPSISDPSRIVNRDVPACDEQAYKAAGYKRGSISETMNDLDGSANALEVAPATAASLGSEELPMEVAGPVVESEPPAAKPRKKKVQN
jgi:hypothetical protein